MGTPPYCSAISNKAFLILWSKKPFQMDVHFKDWSHCEKGGRNENDRTASHESVLIQLKWETISHGALYIGNSSILVYHIQP